MDACGSSTPADSRELAIRAALTLSSYGERVAHPACARRGECGGHRDALTGELAVTVDTAGPQRPGSARKHQACATF